MLGVVWLKRRGSEGWAAWGVVVEVVRVRRRRRGDGAARSSRTERRRARLMASVGGWVTWASRVVGGGGGGLGAGRGAVIGSLVTMVEMEEKLVVCRQLRSAENKVGLGAGGLGRTSWHQLHVFNNASSQVHNSEIMNISV